MYMDSICMYMDSVCDFMLSLITLYDAACLNYCRVCAAYIDSGNFT